MRKQQSNPTYYPPVFLTFAAWFLFSVSPLKAESLMFYIHVDNPSTQEIAIFYFKSPTASDVSIAKTNLDEKGKVAFMMDISHEQLAKVHYGDTVIPVFVSGNQTLEMAFDAANIWKTLAFKGKQAETNNFYADYYRNFPPQPVATFEAAYIKVDFSDRMLSQSRKFTPRQFLQFFKDQETDQRAFFKSYKGLPKQRVEQLARKVRYENITDLLMFFVLNQPYWPKTQMVSELKKNNAFKFSAYREEALINEPFYQNFLKAYLFYSFLPGNPDDFDITNLLYDHTANNFKKQAKYWLQAELMTREFDRTGRTRLATKHFDAFYAENPYPEFSHRVMKTLGMDLDIPERSKAPDFIVMDTDGNKLNLNDFAGQVLYISFWASWCKPCLEGFVKTEYLRRDLEKMGVVLLNISLDKKTEVWQKTLEKQNLIGVNTIADDIEKIQRVFGITTLPAYHIVGKDGYFCYLSDKPNRRILDEFHGFLGTNKY